LRIRRLDENHIEIFPEEQIALFEDLLDWNTEKCRLKSIVCRLEGYSVE